MTARSLALAAVLGALCMAPAPGDVGGCGTEPTPLDPNAYVLARKDQECDRCRACAIPTRRCGRACDPAQPPDTSLPATCRPLRHDGEVCLRALEAASCDAFAAYVDDVAATTPSECQFCKQVPKEGVPIFVFDAGAPAEGGAP